ncbi:hypothetical protein ABZT43_12230 [Streptomyces sp. NPDC005349]|uniref:hypothetical protein n=1 Tax=Streptomyces sp. NPDC005349 TaxID=3157037 RepID=UPI0033B128ED
MALQDIPLAWSRLRTAWRLAGNMAITGNLTVDGSVTIGGSTSTSSPPVPQPADHNLAAWSYDPTVAISTLSPTLGTVYLSAIPIRQTTTISKLWFLLGTAAGTPTAGQNWIGLYNSAGTILSTASLDSVVTGSNTPKSGTLSAAQSVGAGIYWVGMVFNGSTAPVVYKTAMPFTGFANVNQTAATYRYAVNGTSQTALSNITPSSNGAGQSIWVGAS